MVLLIYCDVGILKYCDIMILRFCNTKILRYCDIAISLYYDIVILQYRGIMILLSPEGRGGETGLIINDLKEGRMEKVPRINHDDSQINHTDDLTLT